MNRQPRPQRSQGMLFGDTLADLDTETGYRGPIACKAAGITYRQLDYWARTGLVSPPFAPLKAQVPIACILSAIFWC